MFVKIERDECQVYFVHDDQRLKARWGCKLTKKEMAEWKKATHDFWYWQIKVEDRINEQS